MIVNGYYKERPDLRDNVRIVHEFIEAEREHKCGKTQVSPALSVAAWERTFDFFLKFFEEGVPVIG